MTNANWGASPEDWHHFDLVLGLGKDLLPVVSNPAAVISPASAMKQLGKTPSRYNGRRHVAGITGWTDRQADAQDLAEWSKEPDYGICIQTRSVRAVDVDVTNADQAADIAAAIRRCHPDLPMRIRSNSSKFLVAFVINFPLAKRTIKTDHGIIELLADGQQFVAVGTHPSGARYEWAGGLPNCFPELTLEQLEALWV